MFYIERFQPAVDDAVAEVLPAPLSTSPRDCRSLRGGDRTR